MKASPLQLSSWALVAGMLLGCRSGLQSKAAAPPSLAAPAGAAAPIAPSGPGDAGPVPINPEDPARGAPDALVTIVWFADLQCPFSARAATTLTDLQARYPADQLRIVWKNLPLPFHSEARRAAEHAAAVQALGGDRAFWTFSEIVTQHVSSLDHAPFADWAAQAGVSGQALEAELASGRPRAKVDSDKALAEQLQVEGTPTFFINGALLLGAQPIDKFVESVETQRRRAENELTHGTPRASLYAELTRSGFQKPAASSAGDVADTTVWRVPVGDSPVRGPASALVTIVEFSDFQCPFCKRAQTQLDAIRARYRDDVRFVFKHLPLPFHAHAEPAAELSLEAKKQRGDAGFYLAHDALFAAPGLETSDLETVARTAHLDLARVRTAIATHRYATAIGADMKLAEQVAAEGTPHFFINGRRLVGAQPLEQFTALINEELVKAKALVARGVSRSAVYDELQKEALPPR